MGIFRKITKIFFILICSKLFSQYEDGVLKDYRYFPDHFLCDSINFTQHNEEIFNTEEKLSLKNCEDINIKISNTLIEMGEKSIFMDSSFYGIRFLIYPTYLIQNYLPFLFKIYVIKDSIFICVKYYKYHHKNNTKKLVTKYFYLDNINLLNKIKDISNYPFLKIEDNIAVYDANIIILETRFNFKYHYLYRDIKLENEIKESINSVFQSIKYKPPGIIKRYLK